MTFALATQLSLITVSGPIAAITDHLEGVGSVPIEITGELRGAYNDDDGEVQEFDATITSISSTDPDLTGLDSKWALIGVTKGRKKLREHFEKEGTPLAFSAIGCLENAFNDENPRDFEMIIREITLTSAE